VSRLPFSLCAVLLSLMVAPATATLQLPFGSRVDLIALDICATDRHGAPAAVAAGDLAVFDNGMRQEIVLFSEGDRVPLAVTLLVDSSQSMHHGLLGRAVSAATALIDQLPADSLVEVMSFNDHPAIRFPLGADHARAELALADLAPAGATALYEAVIVAIRNQERASRASNDRYRQVIVLLTDGENTAGWLPFDEVLDEARRSNILVYTVVLPSDDAPDAGPSWRMTQLAVDTGGEIISARSGDDLMSIYQRIAANVRHLYRVGYVPAPLARDGAWHQVQVRAVAKDLVLRTRTGYYAPYQ
jgi:Ca-activated chloride channel family protein